MAKLKNIFNPTPSQIKYRNRKWAEALILNKRKATNVMKDKRGGRCCLKVAEDVALDMGVKIKFQDLNLPAQETADFFGWGQKTDIDVIPELKIPTKDKTILKEATELNDGYFCGILQPAKKVLSHKEIAECVLNTFVHPSKEK